jgi:hypothetical protein
VPVFPVKRLLQLFQQINIDLKIYHPAQYAG